MATHKSAEKEHRRSLARRERNRHKRARLRTAIKKFRAAVAEGDLEKARGMLPGTVALLDRTAKVRAIHPGAADRAKSRLTRLLNRTAAAG
ncbi:MAG TPA: 30S ribosomal protein S20 [Candidatus Polarisedimenticolaceae bacterium]|nr:30S ribosomal protein S20 [Candidatus Polarisedimenticolaceae bacterium]